MFGVALTRPRTPTAGELVDPSPEFLFTARWIFVLLIRARHDLRQHA